MLTCDVLAFLRLYYVLSGHLKATVKKQETAEVGIYTVKMCSVA